MEPIQAYGRCHNCGTARWITPEYLKHRGMTCPRCASPFVRSVRRLDWHERIPLFRDYLWQAALAEPGWQWSHHPVWFVRQAYHWFVTLHFAQKETVHA